MTANRILRQQIQGRVRLSDEVHVAGVTPHPDERWMMQIVRNATTANWGVLSVEHDLIHDRDGKFCHAFQHLIDEAGVPHTPVPQRRDSSIQCRARRGGLSKCYSGEAA